MVFVSGCLVCLLFYSDVASHYVNSPHNDTKATVQYQSFMCCKVILSVCFCCYDFLTQNFTLSLPKNGPPKHDDMSYIRTVLIAKELQHSYVLHIQSLYFASRTVKTYKLLHKDSREPAFHKQRAYSLNYTTY